MVVLGHGLLCGEGVGVIEEAPGLLILLLCFRWRCLRVEHDGRVGECAREEQRPGQQPRVARLHRHPHSLLRSRSLTLDMPGKAIFKVQWKRGLHVTPAWPLGHVTFGYDERPAAHHAAVRVGEEVGELRGEAVGQAGVVGIQPGDERIPTLAEPLYSTQRAKGKGRERGG